MLMSVVVFVSVVIVQTIAALNQIVHAETDPASPPLVSGVII